MKKHFSGNSYHSVCYKYFADGSMPFFLFCFFNTGDLIVFLCHKVCCAIYNAIENDFVGDADMEKRDV